MPLMRSRWRHSSPNFSKTHNDSTLESTHSTASVPVRGPHASKTSKKRSSSSGRPPALRVSSVHESLRRKGLAPSSLKRSVSFGAIQIRDYERVAGDNPSVTRGVPLALGWQYTSYDDISVELYEHQVQRRTKSQLIMSPQVRQSLLKSEWNVSQREIAAAVRKTVKARNQRRQTIVAGDQFLILESAKDGWRALKDKLKRKGDDLKWPPDDDSQDHMDEVNVSDDNLDKTKHKSVKLKIEIEEEETCATGATDSQQGDVGASGTHEGEEEEPDLCPEF